ncbi:MAG: MFS transporter [Firmicutes bacterium]|nr:MFS transporter [Bacillota bacterium]
MSTINGTVVMISLPFIFNGIHVDPLAPGQTGLLLWVLMGYQLAMTVLLVTFGRLSDSLGRVRLYNLGFLVFTIGSILLSITWGRGLDGELQLIIFRVIQGFGGAFLFANSAAILTDAFPPNQRGFALGVNGIASIFGDIIGLFLGGVLAAVDWRLVFLVSVPFGIFGTIWAFIALKEVGERDPQPIDLWGNVTFGVGLTALMVALTYSLMPYGHQAMGWSNPMVIGCAAAGVLLLVAFVFIELRVQAPMFHLSLFKVRPFTTGTVSNLLMSLARGGLQFMLIIWLQGIWLPLHGVRFEDTPLQAGLDLLPMMIGFVVAGPIAGSLSDRMGARPLATAGTLFAAAGFVLLATLPYNFNFWIFAVYLFIQGAGMGLFAAPNNSAVMNSVPARYRGVTSGMNSTFGRAGMTMSMAIFFSMVIAGLVSSLPPAMSAQLTQAGVPANVANRIAQLPPLDALFSALLGYNPMAQLIPSDVLSQLPQQAQQTLLGGHFFPEMIAPPFISSLHMVFYMAAGLCVVAAVCSLLRGKRYVWDEPGQMQQTSATGSGALPAAGAVSSQGLHLVPNGGSEER